MTELKRPMRVADMKELIKDLDDETLICFHSYKGCGLNSYDLNDAWLFPKDKTPVQALVINPGDDHDPRRPGQVPKNRSIIRRLKHLIAFEDVSSLDPFMAGWNCHRAGGERAEGEEYAGCQAGWDEREKLCPRTQKSNQEHHDKEAGKKEDRKEG